MKLHLPSQLRRAVLTCMAAFAGITTTCATGTLVVGALAAQQALATDTYWNTVNYNEHSNSNTTIVSGDRVVVANGTNDQPPTDASYPSGEKYGKGYALGTIVVEDGGQLFIHTHSTKNTSGSIKGMNGAITLNGTENTTTAGLYIQDGSYSFGGPLKISGSATIQSNWAGSQSFTNLTSVNGVDDVLTLDTGNIEGRQVVYTFGISGNPAEGLYNGTIVLETANKHGWGSAQMLHWQDQQVVFSFGAQKVIGTESHFDVQDHTAVWLTSSNLTVYNITLNSYGSYLSNKVGGAQVRQNIQNLILAEGGTGGTLYSGSGTTAWHIDSITGSGLLEVVEDSESYAPSVAYLANANPNFTGTFVVEAYNIYHHGGGYSQYGIYQNYLQVSHPYALSNAILQLDGYTNDYAVLAIDTSDVFIRGLDGSSTSLVFSGEAPTGGTADDPTCDDRPVSDSARVTLHLGEDSTTPYTYSGEILERVNIDKTGTNTQVLYNLADDTSRRITVTEGTLRIGSIGQFGSLNVSYGACAEVGITTDTQVNRWGKSNEFIYFLAYDPQRDVAAGSTVSGNVVFTDELYSRRYDENYKDNTIEVVYFDGSDYTGDSLTLIGADLAVFNPETGKAADLSSVQNISLKNGAALVSGSPTHFYSIADPDITVSSDITLMGSGFLLAYGDLAVDNSGNHVYNAFNVTYSGKIITGTEDDGGEATAMLYKSGMGQVTISGDMSDFDGTLYNYAGTLVLAGGAAPEKQASVLVLYVADKATTIINDAADFTTEKVTLCFATPAAYDGVREADLEIEKGSTLNITGTNATYLNHSDPYDAFIGTFSLGIDVISKVTVDGTLNMTDLSFITTSGSSTAYSRTMDVTGTMNAKGLWLQTYSSGTTDIATFNFYSGSTLNLGTEGIGHKDVDGSGNIKATATQRMNLNLYDGATLGILDGAGEWVTERDMKLGISTATNDITSTGAVTVNTQGYRLSTGKADGAAQVIRLGQTKGGIVKEGLGTLTVAAGSNLESLTVNDGYFSIASTETVYTVTVGKLATSGSGSLLFDLTAKYDQVNNVDTTGQQRVELESGAVSSGDTVNVTVQCSVDEAATASTSPEYGVYAIFGGNKANLTGLNVNLVALVDDGYTAYYTKEYASKGFGCVVISTLDADGKTVTKYGNTDTITWVTSADSNFWANSTEQNWTADGGTTERRFTNGSSVKFEGAGEAVTVLGNVVLGDTMTVSGSGYEFTGTGSIDGSDGSKLVIADGVEVTFSNTGSNVFAGGVELGDASTLRIEYLDDTSDNWTGVVTGGTGSVLEIATGGVRTNVVSSVLAGGKVDIVRLENETTVSLTGSGTDSEAAKLAEIPTIIITDGSRLDIAAAASDGVLGANSVLQIAGEGAPNATGAGASALSLTAITDAVAINAKTELTDDATVYTALATLELDGGFISNGYTLTTTGAGSVGFTNPGASDFSGDMVASNSSALHFNADDSSVATVTGAVTLKDNGRIYAKTALSLQGGLNATGTYHQIMGDIDIDSEVTGESYTTVHVMSGAADTSVTLNDANSFSGIWGLWTGATLTANNANAITNATVHSEYGGGTLALGANCSVQGITGQRINIVSADDIPHTLTIIGSAVNYSYATIGENVSLVMNGKGTQRFLNNDACSNFNGDITVSNGMLEFVKSPGSYSTIAITSDDARLTVGGALSVSDSQTLLITETGAQLNADLAPVTGGSIVLGKLGTGNDPSGSWGASVGKGLNLVGHTLTLNTNDKADLSVYLESFLKEGEYVTLFTNVGDLKIDGTSYDSSMTLGVLGDYFNVDDINMAKAQLELLEDGSIRFCLTADSNGRYWEWEGGSGVWDYAEKAWGIKDEAGNGYSYIAGRDAYFTHDDDAKITLGTDIVTGGVAVEDGSYTFYTDGHDLTIGGRYHEFEDGIAEFVLQKGATLTIEEGMGEVSDTKITSDDDTATTFVLGGSSTLTENAEISNVRLTLDGSSSELDLTDTDSVNVYSLSGEGTIKGDGATLTISDKAKGLFEGSFVSTGNEANTLVIEEGTELQEFNDVTMDSGWSVINEGTMKMKLTDGSSINALTLGENSDTTLTVNTDDEQMMGLTKLKVEDGAKLTLNSTGNAPMMSETKILGTFEDDDLDFGSDDTLEITLGTGAAFLMVDKTQPVTLSRELNDDGEYDLVLNATVDATNKFLPHAGDEVNSTAGAEMLWTEEAMTQMNANPDGDLAQVFGQLADMVTSEKVDTAAVQNALAAVSGASTAVLGSAFSADVERQLKAIRNRTTTMGVGQCEVNENMPYYNAWINAEGDHRELDADGLAPGYTIDSWGGTVGFDADLTPHLTMGLALTAMYGDLETDGADRGEGDFDTMYLTAFARYSRNAWVHTFVATVGRADVSMERTVTVGDHSYTTSGDTDGVAFGFMYEVGRVFALNQESTWCLQPVFNVQLRNSSISGYDEEGSDAAVTVGDQDYTVITFGVGARTQGIVGENLYNRASIFEARALLKIDAGDTDAKADVAMINGAATTHELEAAERGSVGVEIGAGVTIPVGSEGGSVFIDASAELRSGYTDINGTIGYRVNF